MSRKKAPTVRAPRPHVASIRLSDTEHALLASEAQAAGLSISDFIRQACKAELDLRRKLRVVLEQRQRALTLPQGVSVGNPVSIEVSYVH